MVCTAIMQQFQFIPIYRQTILFNCAFKCPWFVVLYTCISFPGLTFEKKNPVDEQYSPLFGSILNLYVNVWEHFRTHLYCMVPFSHFDWTVFKTCSKPATVSLSNPNLSSFILLTYIDEYLYYNVNLDAQVLNGYLL